MSLVLLHWLMKNMNNFIQHKICDINVSKSSADQKSSKSRNETKLPLCLREFNLYHVKLNHWIFFNQNKFLQWIFVICISYHVIKRRYTDYDVYIVQFKNTARLLTFFPPVCSKQTFQTYKISNYAKLSWRHIWCSVNSSITCTICAEIEMFA